MMNTVQKIQTDKGAHVKIYDYSRSFIKLESLKEESRFLGLLMNSFTKFIKKVSHVFIFNLLLSTKRLVSHE
jgi:hypothetical protein